MLNTFDLNLIYTVTACTLASIIVIRESIDYCLRTKAPTCEESQDQAYEVSDKAEMVFEKQEPVLDIVTKNIPEQLIEYSPAPYNHVLWPSPRPKNFVKAIIKEDPDFKQPHQRLAHDTSVDILAERACMSRKDFLRTNPLTYSERYMKGMNAIYLLKGSIDRLEYLLRSETLKQQSWRVENGKTSHY
uniref:Uncharacterized protein n=1 Tax=viral metagenome TaxID=1070528 RepID=A0A6C0ANB1_9ZZZZ